MNEMEKAIEMLENDQELKDKFYAEAQRLVENNEAADAQEALTKAAKTVLGIDLAGKAKEEFEKLDVEELDSVTGGYDQCGHFELSDLNEEELKQYNELNAIADATQYIGRAKALQDLCDFKLQMDLKYGSENRKAFLRFMDGK